MTYRVTTDAESRNPRNQRQVWTGEASSEEDAEWEAKMVHLRLFKGRERSVWVVSVEEVA